MQNSSTQKEEDIFSQIPQIYLDDEGVFKYILIKCELGEQEEFYFIRGYKKFEFHAENYEQFLADLKKTNIVTMKPKMTGKFINSEINGIPVNFECVGGGRVDHSKKQQRLFIYGYSQSYGQADHLITQDISRKYFKYPKENYKVSFEGY